MNIDELLSARINLPEVKRLATLSSGSRANLRRLWESARSDDRRISVNALWVMTHLPDSDSDRLSSLRDDMIDMVLTETDTAKKRLLLQILREQRYDSEDIRADFVDFCMSKINSECEPYAIRCYSIYIVYKMSRQYPELLRELEEHLDMMTFQTLSPGLRSALRQTKSKIKSLRIQDC